MSKLLYALVVFALISLSVQQDDLSYLGTMLRTYECGQIVSKFYAKLDGILDNFNNLNNAQQIVAFAALGNQYLTSNAVITINLPTGPLVSVGITQFSLLAGNIALVDCGEDHLFGPFVTYNDTLLSIALWFNEVSFANQSPTGFCSGAVNGTGTLIPGRFEVTCSRTSLTSPWLLSNITESFRGTLATTINWTPGWLAMNLPDNTYP